MKNAIHRHNIFILVFCVITAIWVISMLLKAYMVEGSQILFSEGKSYSCSYGWFDESNHRVNMNEITFTKEDLGKKHFYRYNIPKGFIISEGDSICFFCRGMDFKAYVKTPITAKYFGSDEYGSRKIYEYSQNAAGLSGTDIGLVAQTIPIYKTDTANEITFVITPRETSALILDMRIQQTSDFILNTIRSRMDIFIQSVAIIFFGISTVLYTFFDIEKKREEKTLFYAWGAFSFLFGTMLAIETQVLQILT